MYKYKLEREIRCPLEYGLSIFSGKWKTRIVCLILNSGGTLRYSEIKNAIKDISDAVLAAMLKDLISDGIVIRTQYNEIPLKVEYALTPKAESVIPIMHQLCLWANKYMEFDVIKSPPCTNCIITRNEQLD